MLASGMSAYTPSFAQDCRRGTKQQPCLAWEAASASHLLLPPKMPVCVPTLTVEVVIDGQRLYNRGSRQRGGQPQARQRCNTGRGTGSKVVGGTGQACLPAEARVGGHHRCVP